MQNPALWERLVAFDFDKSPNGEVPTFSFANRLARENGWDLDYSRRVVEEYRRFLYLACEAGHVVSPSDEVDQAWHLHLTYSRSYWENLCPNVLKKPLHHEPTRGGKAEGEKFENLYERTKETYQHVFGEIPPADIWPSTEIRFKNGRHFQRINTQNVWVVPKPAILKSRQIRFNRENLKIVPVLGFTLLLAGCAYVQTDMQTEGINVFNWHGEAFLAFFWMACAVGIGFSLWMRSQYKRPFDAVFPIEPLNAYELARLKDGKNLAVDVAIASLYEKQLIVVTPDGKLQQSTTPSLPVLSDFEKFVWKEIGAGVTVSGLRQSMASYARQIDHKLIDLGLLLKPNEAKRINDWPLGTILLLFAIGIAKIIIGISRERPVGFITLSCFFLALIFFWFLANSPRRSLRGDLLLKKYRTEYSSPSARGVSADTDMQALYFAIAGFGVFPLAIQRAMQPPNPMIGSGGGGTGCSTSSSGCGSGGGSSGCGSSSSGCGGGGGCGGCGGS